MGEDNLGRGLPRPNIANNSSPDTENVGAGLAPALHPETRNVGTGLAPSSQSSNSTFQPPHDQANPSSQSSNSTFQPSHDQVNPSMQTSTSPSDSAQQPFLEGLRRLNLELTEQQFDQFLRYRQELLSWNTHINLTAINDPGEILLKHFLDSLSLLMVYDVSDARLLDIGAGAGFPGIPLKIVRPQWQVLLLEATGKKVTFMRHIIETLQLCDVQAVHGRAEELAHKPEYRTAFDVLTARAVASLPVLLEYAAPFCRVGGQIILPKKGDLTEELAQGMRAARQLGVVLKDSVAVRLPGLEDGRKLLVWEQVKKCPEQFPRSGSVISKKPLGLLE